MFTCISLNIFCSKYGFLPKSIYTIVCNKSSFMYEHDFYRGKERKEANVLSDKWASRLQP